MFVNFIFTFTFDGEFICCKLFSGINYLLSLEVDCLDNAVTLNSQKNIWHRSQPWCRAFSSTLAHSRYNYHYSPKKLWVQNCLKFISGNYNFCEAMSSFIKNLRHVLSKNLSSGLRFKHENIVFKNYVDNTLTKL